MKSKPLSRSRSKSKGTKAHKSRPGRSPTPKRRSSSRGTSAQRSNSPVTPKQGGVGDGKQPVKSSKDSSKVLLEKDLTIKNIPPEDASPALLEICKENPLFLVSRRKSGR